MTTAFKTVQDLAYSMLALDITNIQTTMSIATGEGVRFGAAPFIIAIGWPGADGTYSTGVEKVLVTVRVADAFSTCTRSYGGTTAPVGGWAAGTPVRLNWCEDYYDALTGAVNGIESGATALDKVTASDLTASRIVASDGDKKLASIANLTSWIAGTANRVTVSDDGDGTITLSAPQDAHTGASPTFVGETLSGLTASRLMASSAAKALVSVANLTTWVAGTANRLSVANDGDGSITLNVVNTPQLTGLLLSGLTASRLTASDGTKNLVSVANLASWIGGTANRVTVADDGDGSVTLSGPQDIASGSSPTFTGLTVSGLTATRLVATGGASALASVADLAAWVAGTANRVTVANDGDGTITLSGPQDLAAASSPSFTGLTVSGLTASRLIATGAGGVLASVADLTAWIAGTANQIISTTDGDGTLTLSLPTEVRLGVEDTTQGVLRLYGTATGYGGALIIENAGDQDGAVNGWQVCAVAGSAKFQVLEGTTPGSGTQRLSIGPVDATFDGNLLVDGNLTVGEGAAGVDYTLTFNGEDHDAVITWLEDERQLQIAAGAAGDGGIKLSLGSANHSVLMGSTYFGGTVLQGSDLGENHYLVLSTAEGDATDSVGMYILAQGTAGQVTDMGFSMIRFVGGSNLYEWRSHKVGSGTAYPIRLRTDVDNMVYLEPASAGGHVGILTNVPATELDVNGYISGTGVIIDNNDACGLSFGASGGTNRIVGTDVIGVANLNLYSGVGINLTASSVNVPSGALACGANSATVGHITLWDGAANAPGYIKIASTNGTVWYFFVSNAGALRYHNAIPTADGDGNPV